jgi:hypothetical protein
LLLSNQIAALCNNFGVRKLLQYLFAIYRRFRILLFGFALGLSFVWMVKGPPSLWEVPVNLPTASSDVLPVVAYKNWEMPEGGGSGPDGPRKTVIAAPGTAAQDRELSLYDIVTEVNECSWAETPQRSGCLAERQRARQFIYDHWRLKKRGYISVDFPCTDCLPILHLFIEPDNYGSWHVSAKLEDDRYGFSDRDDAFDVKWRRAASHERRLESTSKVLSFLDRSGKEIYSF